MSYTRWPGCWYIYWVAGSVENPELACWHDTSHNLPSIHLHEIASVRQGADLAWQRNEASVRDAHEDELLVRSILSWLTEIQGDKMCPTEARKRASALVAAHRVET